MMYQQSMRDALLEVELNKSIPQDDEVEQLDESLLGLLRTGAIAVNVRNSVQSGKKIQQHARDYLHEKTQKTHRKRSLKGLEHFLTYS